MFDYDCWLDWEPDPDRASREALPNLEPFASMTKRQLLARMLDAKGGREWEFLQEFFLDRCTDEELAVSPAEFIRTQYRLFRSEERRFLTDSVALALRRRSGTPDPPHAETEPRYQPHPGLWWASRSGR